MFALGPSLREARTRRGLTPADVHKALRIRERYLTALEEEQWELLPGDAYTKGFLRTYAEFLDLDGRLYVDEYTSRAAQHDEEPLVPESLRRTRRASPLLLRSVAAVVLVAAVVGGLAAWRHGDSSPPPRVPAASSASPAAHHARRTRRAQPAAGSHPRPTFTLIRAVRDASWLSVRIGGPTGKEIFQGTLYPGQALKYGLRRGIWVRMGRPFALDVRIGGRLVAGLPATPANVLLTRSGARR